MRRVLSWIVLFIGLVPLWLVFLRFVGMRGSSYLIPVTLFYTACVIGLALVARRATIREWLVAGSIVLLGLFVPTSRLMENAGSVLSLGETIFKIALFLWPSIALIMAAVLLYSGFKLSSERESSGAIEGVGLHAVQDSRGRLAAACFGVSGLLILKTLHNLYGLTIWDTTDDPLGYIWIVVPVLAAVFSGFLLIINLRKWAVLAGLAYLVLVPGLMIAVSARAQQADFRQITEMRAEQVSKRVEAYYARQGRYPADLRQLTPWYAFPLPEPMIIYGQNWCYDAGDDYYLVGYVYREHWSSPELIGRIYKTAGEPPEPDNVCAEEIEAIKHQSSDFYGE